jgi:hypothetical protein
MWSRREELNTPPADYRSAALTLSYTGKDVDDRLQNGLTAVNWRINDSGAQYAKRRHRCPSARYASFSGGPASTFS